jgi:hypothetical protein
MKVAITGATGFVGSRLVERLQALGHQPIVLTRQPDRAKQKFAASPVEIINYDPMQSGAWQATMASCDAVVNLAGEPIADQRWTAEYKQKLMDSRVKTTEHLVAAISQANPKPQVLVNASAVGFYGTSETASFDETSAAGNDYLAEICHNWEAAASKVKDSGTRLVILRFGIVLGLGGALGKMLTPFQMFLGGPIGSGNQWMSWVHLDDVVELIITAITNTQMQGVYNATAPHPVRMMELCQALGRVMQRPSWLPVPGFALEALLGDGALVVLEGQQVLPKQTLTSGFNYRYPTVEPALKEILSR